MDERNDFLEEGFFMEEEDISYFFEQNDADAPNGKRRRSDKTAHIRSRVASSGEKNYKFL